MLSLIKKSVSRVSSSILERVQPVITYIKSTAIGRAFIQVSKNLYNTLYHTGSAIGHFIGGILGAAFKLCSGFAAILAFSAPTLIVSATLAFNSIKVGTYAAGNSLRQAFRSLRGIDEEKLVIVQAELSLPKDDSYGRIVSIKIKQIFDAILTLPALTKEETEGLKSDGDTVYNGFTEILRIEKGNFNIGIVNVDSEQHIQENLYKIYTSARNVALFFINRIAQNNSTVTIEEISENPTSTTNNRLLMN